MVNGIAACWLVGGAAVSLLTLRRDKSQKQEEGGPESPRTPRNSVERGADPAASWLISQGTPNSDASRSEHPRDGLVATHAQPRQHQLTEGSLVCFYSEGHLLVVKQAGAHWTLQPVPWGYHQEEGGLSFFPASSLFYVVKQGSSVGFKSYSAGGFMLQAAKAADVPHRLSNQNFGSWEKWQLHKDGFVNQRWGKALGLEIKELRCILVEDMRRYERRHVKNKAALMDQIQMHVEECKMLKDRAAALERAATDSISWGRNMQQEYGSLKSRASLHKADLLHKTSLISQLENRLSEAQAEKREMIVLLGNAEERIHNIEASAQEARAVVDRERFKDKQEHTRVLETALAECRQKDAELAVVKENAEQSFAEMSEQLKVVCEDRDRMDFALQSISGMNQEGGYPATSNGCDAPGPLRELRAMLLAGYQGQQNGSPASSLPEREDEPQHLTLGGNEEARAQPLNCAPAISQFERIPTDTKGVGLDMSPSCQSEQTNLTSISRQIPHLQAMSCRRSKSAFLELLAPALGGSEKLMNLLGSGEHSPTGSECSIDTPRILSAAEFHKQTHGR